MENGLTDAFVSEFIKICGITVLCVAVIMIVKEVRGGFAGVLRISGIILISVVLIADIGDLRVGLGQILDMADMNKYTSAMLKALGIAFLVKICSDICKDCGEANLAFGVESAGKICVLAMSLPFVQDIMEYAKEFLRLGDI